MTLLGLIKLRGHFVGIAEHVGHVMTYKILTDTTQKVILRSNVRSALDPLAPNLHVDPLNGALQPVIRSRHDSEDGTVGQATIPVMDPHDLVGRIFLMDPGGEEQHQHVHILEMIDDHESATTHNPENVKFRCSMDNDEYEEILSYNDIINFLANKKDSPTV